MKHIYVFTFVVLSLFLVPSAQAQSDTKPLYNVKSRANTATTLYNNGIRPLSLRQMVENRGSEFSGDISRYDDKYRPYSIHNNSSGNFSSYDEVEAFRAQQAARAQRAEEEARQAFLSYKDSDADQSRDERTQGYLSRFQNTGDSNIQVQPRTRVLYQQRRQDVIEKPKRLFNSVR